ncbi:MAG TPA: class I SAM-dependent methyltransferase, partial [Mycobacterium sp.]
MTRSENDTWDLASSVGATATAVALQRAIASQGPDPLLEDPWADPLVRAVGSETFIKLLDTGLGQNTDAVLSRQPVREQITVRTRFFDDFFLQ